MESRGKLLVSRALKLFDDCKLEDKANVHRNIDNKNEKYDTTIDKKTWNIEQTDRLTRIKVTRVQPHSNDDVQSSDTDPDLASNPDDTDEDPDFNIDNERTKRTKSFNFLIGKGCKKKPKNKLGNLNGMSNTIYSNVAIDSQIQPKPSTSFAVESQMQPQPSTSFAMISIDTTEAAVMNASDLQPENHSPMTKGKKRKAEPDNWLKTKKKNTS